MVDVTDNLINDIQDYFQDKEPPYMKKMPRLHPDNLLHRALLKIEDMQLEIDEQRSEIKDLEYEILDLEAFHIEEKD